MSVICCLGASLNHRRPGRSTLSCNVWIVWPPSLLTWRCGKGVVKNYRHLLSSRSACSRICGRRCNISESLRPRPSRRPYRRGRKGRVRARQWHRTNEPVKPAAHRVFTPRPLDTPYKLCSRGATRHAWGVIGVCEPCESRSVRGGPQSGARSAAFAGCSSGFPV